MDRPSRALLLGPRPPTRESSTKLYSTLSDLPPELLLEIFNRFCEAPKSPASLSSVRVTHPAPLLLGKICRQWRYIAFASPPLWTYIYLVRWTDKLHIQIKLLNDYLGRSKDLPLTIVLRKENNYQLHRLSDHDSLPLYQLIAKECHRWEAIDLFIPGAGVFVTYMNSACHYLPLLRTAWIQTLHPGLQANFVQHSPQLRFLALSVFTLTKMDVPYYHLTHLRASRLVDRDVLNVLKNTPNLRSCVLMDVSRAWGAAPLPKINLKHLESFTLHRCPGADSLLPQIVSVPSLREFRCTTGPGWYLPLDLVKELLDRGSSRLETLELEASELRVEDLSIFLDPLLRRTETLTRLVLHFDVIDAEEESAACIARILDPLWPPAPQGLHVDMLTDDHPVICPALQHLELRLIEGSFLPILNMLKHRWLFGRAVTSDSSPVQHSSSGQRCAKIASTHIPGRCRSEAMLHLGDEIRDGMVVDFLPECPEDTLVFNDA